MSSIGQVSRVTNYDQQLGENVVVQIGLFQFNKITTSEKEMP